MGRSRAALPGATGAFEPGRQVGLHGAVEQGTFGLAAAIESGAGWRARGGGGHGHPHRVIGMNDCMPIWGIHLIHHY